MTDTGMMMQMTITTAESASPMSAPMLDHLAAAVIGGGKISEQHLRPLSAMEDVQIAGICDLSPALARFTAERFGCSDWYTDYRTMLDRCGANVVHVLTPPATHDQIVRDCLDAGCHVIVEKPISLSNVQFRNLWEIASSRGLCLIENHNYRFNAPILQISEQVESGRIGTVVEVEIRMVLNIRGGGRYADEHLPHPSHQLPAGVIHEFISHLSYLLLHFIPDDNIESVECVRAAWRNHGGGRLFKYDDLDAIIGFGAIHGRIRFSSRQWPDCLSVQVRGSDGIVAAELFHPSVQVTARRAIGQHLTPLINSLAEARSKTRGGFGSIWQKVRNRTPYEGLDRFLKLTYEAFRSGGPLPVSFDDMDRTSRLIDTMLAPENCV